MSQRTGPAPHVGARPASSVLMIALGFAQLLLLPACRGVGERLRPHTYPPSFSYISEEQLRSAMWVLAAEVRELDEVLARPEHREPELQRTTAAILARMREAARRVDTPGRSTNHPLLGQHLPELELRIDRAMRDVQRDPPGYFYATTLVESCSLCHGPAIRP